MVTSLLKYIVENIVSSPEDVSIREIPGDEETIIEVRVAENDVGKVIGKNGSVARALRTLVSAIGNSENQNYSLEIID